MDSRGKYVHPVLLILIFTILLGLVSGSDAAPTMDTPDKLATRPVISEMVDQEVSVGSTVTFDCQVRSLTPPVIHWWKIDESSGSNELIAIPDEIDILINTPRQENMYSQTLRIYNVTLEDAGSYICYAACYNQGTSRESALLTVSPATRPVISSLANQEVHAGSTITFDCQAMSFTAPTFEWWKADKSSGKEHELIRAIPDKIDILVNTLSQENVYSQTLRIYRVTLEDAGSYMCIAGNDHGFSLKVALLTVTSVRPFIIATLPIIFPMGKQKVSVGSAAAMFNCRVQSSTAPIFEWWKTETQSSSNRRLVAIPKKIDIRVNNPFQENVYTQTLRINSVTKEDAGYYLCHAENTVGSSTKIAELEVTSAPPKNKPPPKNMPPPRRGGCMKISAPGTLALNLMLLCGYAFGNHNLFFD